MTKAQTREPARQVEVVEPTALQAIQRAEIDSTIATAKNYPRDMKVALAEARKMATLTEAIAEECHYSLPKTDKNGKKINIQGPSVRFAEILASQWGNLRIASRVTDITASQVVSQGVCLDLEKNVGYDVEVRKSILSKGGRKYSSDMITVTANAASAMGRRNAILSAIPKPLWNPIYETTLNMIGGGSTPLTESWHKAVAWFGSRGVEEPTLRAAVELEKPSAITQEQIQRLRGWRNAIEQDGTAVEEIFGAPEGEPAAGVEPDEAPPARKPPTEVKGPEPDSTETEKAKAKLVKEWRAIGKDLSGSEIREAREVAGVHMIDIRCTLAQLEAAVRKASEIAEGRRE